MPFRQHHRPPRHLLGHIIRKRKVNFAVRHTFDGLHYVRWRLVHDKDSWLYESGDQATNCRGEVVLE